MVEAFKVGLVIVGAQKCGTATLSDVLSSHPSLVCCREKEPQFFSTSPAWRAGIGDYERLFRPQEGAIHFEASTTYTFFPHRNLEVWKHIFDYNPEMMIIYIVRDPIERLISAYMHDVSRGWTTASLETALISNPRFLNVTRYASQIRPYVEIFGRERVCILFFEDLVTKRSETLAQVAAFLRVDLEGFIETPVHSNKSVGEVKLHHRLDRLSRPLRALQIYAPALHRRVVGSRARRFAAKPTLAPELRSALLYLLRHEVDEIEAMTGRDLRGWRA